VTYQGYPVEGIEIKAVFISMVILSAGSLLISSCSDESVSELPEIDYYLIVTDSIGVESGDSNYVFYWPMEACHTPNDQIAVVDMARNEVLFYSDDGQFLKAVGEEGEGPGRFSTPYDICFYSDGSFLVKCANGISKFDAEGNFLDRMIWPMYTPSLIKGLDDGSFIGIQKTMEGTYPDLWVTFELCRWKDGTDPEIVYFSNGFQFPLPDEDGTVRVEDARDHFICACATQSGRIFTTLLSVDNFDVFGFEPDGTQYLHIIDSDYTRIPKTQEEIHREIQESKSDFSMMSGGTINRTIVPDPFRPAISSLHLDDEDRLWVRLAYCPGIVFRVYDQDGNVLCHVEVQYSGDQLDLTDWSMSINEYGYLAYIHNSEDCPRIYTLELMEAR
jgi:hypothetical protein